MMMKPCIFGNMIVVAVIGMMPVLATAQTETAAQEEGECTETGFEGKNVDFYLKAENALLVDDNPQVALVEWEKLRVRKLNCYEKGFVHRLGGSIKNRLGDYVGAIAEFNSVLQSDNVEAEDRLLILHAIANLYIKADNIAKSLEAFAAWIKAGAKPSRDDKWLLASLNQRLDRNQEAVRWGEAVLKEDGINAKQEIYDFLIYLYNKTGNLEKKAELLEVLLARNPMERNIWNAISADYFRAEKDRKAFEVQKAMYFGGLLNTEKELVRIVNFYQRFDVPYRAAKILEKEMNAGRVQQTYKNLELLANLYQIAREYEKAIPVIEKAALVSSNGLMYERLGRSYSEIKQWKQAENALLKALEKGGLRDVGMTWMMIGQSRYENGDRAGARAAFRKANNRGGRGWLQFMQTEEYTTRQLTLFNARSLVRDLTKEKELCKNLDVLFTAEQKGESCQTVDERLDRAKKEFESLSGETA